MGYVQTKKLREKFPLLATEYPGEFRMFFDSESNMTKLGLDVNQMLKEERRARMIKRRKK